jgi:hypothetical protein
MQCPLALQTHESPVAAAARQQAAAGRGGAGGGARAHNWLAAALGLHALAAPFKPLKRAWGQAQQVRRAAFPPSATCTYNDSALSMKALFPLKALNPRPANSVVGACAAWGAGLGARPGLPPGHRCYLRGTCQHGAALLKHHYPHNRTIISRYACTLGSECAATRLHAATGLWSAPQPLTPPMPFIPAPSLELSDHGFI